MCVCPQEMDHSINGAANATAGFILAPGTTSTTTMATTAIAHIATTMGPHFARQVMRYNNLTVADKVPPDMIHLVGAHW